MATEEVYLLLFGIVVLVIVFVAVLLYAIKRLRRRRAQLITELNRSPRLDADRAFNRLEMARRELGIVARQGTDVSRARELVAQAQSALDLRQFERAYELAQSAHESLVAARQGLTPSAPLPSADPMTPRSGPRATPGPDGPAPSAASTSFRASTAPLPTPAATSTGMPRNRAESQFEMRLLDSDLEKAQQAAPSAPGTLSGIDFQQKAQAAFATGQYTEAFRFALKGRRGLGGNVETVALTPGSWASDAGFGGTDPAQAAESAASAARCPSCGYPTTAGDVFCRGCGAPRTPTVCPRCGTSRTPSDTFCGRCGERFS